jgi:hypothetical protein
MDPMELKIGDWVKSYSAGIWQIYDILTYKCLDPVKNTEQSETMVFLKRFVNSQYKRAFTEETCNPWFVKPLNKKDRSVLNKFIEKNDALVKKFSDYVPERLDCIYNARIRIPDNLSQKEIERKIPKDRPFRDLDINGFLEKAGFDTKGFPQWTLQFVSSGFEIDKGYLIYRFSRLLKS